MLHRTTLLLICAFSFGSGSPIRTEEEGMVKRTESGVPLFLVTDFQIIERTEDIFSSEEFSGTADSNERTKRDANGKVVLPQALIDYMSNALQYRITYPKTFESMKLTRLNNRLPKRYIEEDFGEDYDDNELQVLHTAPARPSPGIPPVEKPIFPHEESWPKNSVLQSWSGDE